jgi:streptogramin lyase
MEVIVQRQRLSFLIVLGLCLGLALPVAAQEGPSQSELPARAIPPHPTTAITPSGGGPDAAISHARPVAAAPTAPQVAIGQPGLAFRWVQTFGAPNSAYFSDTAHLNWPYGIGADGNNIWIGEAFGHRALKYNSAGALVAQIGLPGINDYANGVSIREIRDVTVDPAGHTWLVDGGGGQVLEYDENLQFVRRLGQQWNHGSGNAQFDQPDSVAIDTAGRIYVSDGAPEYSNSVGNHRIQIFDSNGAYLSRLGQTGVAGSSNTQFRGPRHIVIYDNLLYVADAGNNRIQIFDVSSSPTYTDTLQPASNDPNSLANPSGVAVDANYIYVADTGHQRVQIFNRTKPHGFVATISTWQSGTLANQFKNPSDVAVDAAGNIYVADYWNQRVQQFSSARVPTHTYGTTGVPYLTDGSHFFEPNGVAATPDGGLYVIEEHGARLVKLDANGARQWAVGEPGIGGGWDGRTDHFNNAAGVAADAAGRAYVADTWNHRIVTYNADGSYAGTMGMPGVSGSDSIHFNAPQGVYVAANNWVYVADTNNQRVQIFDATHRYVATLGQPGQSGADNAHFNGPRSVAVDGNGVIYVSDINNQRVQVFGANRAYLRTIGQTGVSRYDFGHFDTPAQLAVDAANNLYVADAWQNRVLVYNPSGAYLTTIGFAGDSGMHGQLHGAFGVAIGRGGAVYVSSYWDNATVQKFMPAGPNWRQLNVNGFGDQISAGIDALASFGGVLYAATYTATATLWRMNSAGAWTLAADNGFGDTNNREIMALTEFQNNLYAGTANWECDDPTCTTFHSNGGQIWRSSGTTWNRVTLPPSFGAWNQAVVAFGVLTDTLYAGTSTDAAHGAEIWRTTDGVTWEQSANNGLSGDIYNAQILTLTAYNGSLYAGTRHFDGYADSHPNGPLGGEVWRLTDNGSWTLVNAPGFGDVNIHRVEKLIVFNGALYALASRWPGQTGGGQVWRCTAATCESQADWQLVADNGFGVEGNQYLYTGVVFRNRLYAAAHNNTTGVQLWSSANGTDWTKALADDGFGTGSSILIDVNALIVHNGRLTAGVYDAESGGKVWQLLNFDYWSYLPMTLRK